MSSKGRMGASPAMIMKWAGMRQAVAEAMALKGSLEATEYLARLRGEETEWQPSGALVVSSRDGLLWLAKRSRIGPAQAAAGLRFREDYERANGTGVRSAMAEPATPGARRVGPGKGPSEAMLTARDAVRSALKALGTPLLEKYAVLVAGEGRMLSDPAFTCGDPTKAREHQMACVAALDILSRHYGMVS